jgi:hypothetical protein
MVSGLRMFLPLEVDVLYHIEIKFILFLDLLANILSIILFCRLIEFKVVLEDFISRNVPLNLLITIFLDTH